MDRIMLLAIRQSLIKQITSRSKHKRPDLIKKLESHLETIQEKINNNNIFMGEIRYDGKKDTNATRNSRRF